jgi:hypothetical protein
LDINKPIISNIKTDKKLILNNFIKDMKKNEFKNKEKSLEKLKKETLNDNNMNENKTLGILEA